ncbi:flagellar hook-associated protein FlgK [Thalassobacillus hwangdonensis]|uniref:Flagellar hook-associated protein 1 n=1 Tax=Thalassobacillus hwangdonensis TaxID=546108 RepID=A0ABW3L4R9_9BACI
MVSTFHGLEVAKRGLYAQQSALYTTGHNISNANTEGYTRQRVNFEQTGPFPPASRNRPEIPGQVGSGVMAGAIERVREKFLDAQYRGEQNKVGYWETMADSIGKMEEIMNEPSEHGLSNTMDSFWQSLQDLASNPDEGARSVVVERGIAVAETFNYLSTSLKGVQSDLQHELDVTVTDVNSTLNQIDELNKKIAAIEPHGYLPNDLYDARDRLVDKLSGMMDIEVQYDGKEQADQMGQASIVMINGGERHTLIDPSEQNVEDRVKQIHIDYPTVDGQKVMGTMTVGGEVNDDGTLVAGTGTTVSDFQSQGKLLALKETLGYTDGSGNLKGEYPKMLGNLDKMAYAFAKEFNDVHRSGASLKDIEAGSITPISFFVSGADDLTSEGMDYTGLAGSLEVNQLIQEDSNYIAAAEVDPDTGEAFSGNGENALNLANVKDATLSDLGNNATVKTYYEGVIGKMAVASQEAQRMNHNSLTLRQSVDERRQSVSAVSLDEEMTNMIKFQHAYNASARNITAVDEMIDRIINQMGLVGR